MASTPNLGLTTYGDADNPTVKAWRDTINHSSVSAFTIIDAAIGNLGTFTAFTPTFTGWDLGQTFSYVARYTKIGKLVIAVYNISAGVSINGVATATLPVTPRDSNWSGLNGYAVNGGAKVETGSRWVIVSSGPYVYFYANTGTGSWITSGNKLIQSIVIYESSS